MTLATSCAQDELQSSQAAQSEISFNASMGLRTRATETETSNLNTFNVSAFKSESANYMTDVTYTKSGNEWKSPENEKYFWPVSDALNFYAYAPTTGAGTVTINNSTKQIVFSAANKSAANQGAESEDLSDADAQVDLIYAVTPNQTKPTEANGKVSLNFKHALSEISVQAKNSNTAYQVVVTGVQIGNVVNKGTYTLPTTTVKDAATTDGSTIIGTWDNSTTSTDKATFTTNFTKTAVTLKSDALSVDGSKPFMLIPQTLTKGTSEAKSKYSVGHYIALNVTITQKSGVDGDTPKYEGSSYKGWAYVGIDGTWEQGKHYTYVLDFKEGAGQDENGNQILSGDEIIATCSVTEFTKESKEDTNMSGKETN